MIVFEAYEAMRRKRLARDGLGHDGVLRELGADVNEWQICGSLIIVSTREQRARDREKIEAQGVNFETILAMDLLWTGVELGRAWLELEQRS